MDPVKGSKSSVVPARTVPCRMVRPERCDERSTRSRMRARVLRGLRRNRAAAGRTVDPRCVRAVSRGPPEISPGRAANAVRPPLAPARAGVAATHSISEQSGLRGAWGDEPVDGMHMLMGLLADDAVTDDHDRARNAASADLRLSGPHSNGARSERSPVMADHPRPQHPRVASSSIPDGTPVQLVGAQADTPTRTRRPTTRGGHPEDPEHRRRTRLHEGASEEGRAARSRRAAPFDDQARRARSTILNSGISWPTTSSRYH